MGKHFPGMVERSAQLLDFADRMDSSTSAPPPGTAHPSGAPGAAESGAEWIMPPAPGAQRSYPPLPPSRRRGRERLVLGVLGGAVLGGVTVAVAMGAFGDSNEPDAQTTTVEVQKRTPAVESNPEDPESPAIVTPPRSTTRLLRGDFVIDIEPSNDGEVVLRVRPSPSGSAPDRDLGEVEEPAAQPVPRKERLSSESRKSETPTSKSRARRRRPTVYEPTEL
jgi:hypothetical protein